MLGWTGGTCLIVLLTEKDLILLLKTILCMRMKFLLL